MYNYFKGILVEKKSEHIVLDVNGIGYEFICPLLTSSVLPEIGNEVVLYSYLYVREDILRLYGFSLKQEKDFFILLISISGLGPKAAISILSNMNVNDFKYAILENNIALITKIPGIGKKTAERIILELKSKIEKIELTINKSELNLSLLNKTKKDLENDVLSALISLGYRPNEAKKSFEKLAQNKNINDMSLEQMITTCLKE